MLIREASEEDFDQIWDIFHPIVAAGETYTYARDITRGEAHRVWMEMPHRTFVAEVEGRILGTYYIKPNQGGGGAHVCNCGYMVAEAARGMGLATRMCEHSLEVAPKLGYRAMQYNFVVSTNVGAIGLWKKLGFEEIGRLPKAFDHPQEGLVDAVVMYQWLG